MDKSTGWFSCTCLFVILLIGFSVIGSIAMEDYIDSKEKSSQVEVRAVFIECMEREEEPDSEITRFQRQERFKHNALNDCIKKVALTIKIASEPNFRLVEDDYKSPQTPAEEYIPIDHVFEGPERKRLRLLNPYILRLRREAPRQAYKLNRFDTVNCILTNSGRTTYSADKENGNNLIRAQRDTENALNDWGQAALFTLEHDEPGRHSFSIRIANQDRPFNHVAAKAHENQAASKDCGLRLFALKPLPQNDLNASAYSLGSLVEDESAPSYEVCFNDNDTLIREKRHEHNIIIEGSHFKKRVIKDRHRDDKAAISDDASFEKSRSNDRLLRNKEKRPGVRHHKNSKTSTNVNHRQDNKRSTSTDKMTLTKMPKDVKENEHNQRRHPKNAFDEELYLDYPERIFALYEIGNPNIWYNVQVQLFEKLSNPDGKTVWNDLTNGQPASISALNPEWKRKDVHLRYRPAEYVGRDEFTLPKTSLCLLEPLLDSDSNFTADADSIKHDYSDKYIVVPIEDVIGVEEALNAFKREHNGTDSTTSSDGYKERHRKLLVRVSRALIGSNIDNFNIASHGSERFLTLPHRRSHRAQIDVEIRADDNQLIRVGSSGRLSTIVSDHTRKTRAVLTVQATNTGLASAGFRASVRDCGPELTELINEKSSAGTTSGRILLPPQHTQNLRLELAIEFPVEIAHCSVALVNDEDEAVAVRDVAIKKGDRCFCVFHCDCVCLSEDPKLLCREMSETRQVAAGLTNLGHTRRSRSTVYLDTIILDAWAAAVGVIVFLLALGLCKAYLGLFYVGIGNWGLCEMVTSTKIKNYFENDLKGQDVVYDDFDRPIHPQTHKPVRMFSRTTQFALNLVFFVIMPGLLICTCVKNMLFLITPKTFNTSYKNISEKCFSSHDIQNVKLFLRRRRNELQKWMTPPAEELTETIWNKGLSVGDESGTKSENHNPSPMQPLLHDHDPTLSMNGGKRDVTVGHTTAADMDSEQDDTLYVLTQMQKSRESLARSQRKQNESGTSTDRNHQGDAAAAGKR